MSKRNILLIGLEAGDSINIKLGRTNGNPTISDAQTSMEVDTPAVDPVQPGGESPHIMDMRPPNGLGYAIRSGTTSSTQKCSSDSSDGRMSTLGGDGSRKIATVSDAGSAFDKSKVNEWLDRLERGFPVTPSTTSDHLNKTLWDQTSNGDSPHIMDMRPPNGLGYAIRSGTTSSTQKCSSDSSDGRMSTLGGDGSRKIATVFDAGGESPHIMDMRPPNGLGYAIRSGTTSSTQKCSSDSSDGRMSTLGGDGSRKIATVSDAGSAFDAIRSGTTSSTQKCSSDSSDGRMSTLGGDGSRKIATVFDAGGESPHIMDMRPPNGLGYAIRSGTTSSTQKCSSDSSDGRMSTLGGDGSRKIATVSDAGERATVNAKTYFGSKFDFRDNSKAIFRTNFE